MVEGLCGWLMLGFGGLIERLTTSTPGPHGNAVGVRCCHKSAIELRKTGEPCVIVHVDLGMRDPARQHAMEGRIWGRGLAGQRRRGIGP